MDDLISVVIPVYNVEKYLEKCLDSVVGQTYGNLEIILVDDGSTDNSGAICGRYAQKDSRVVVIHQKNKGVSAARNTGLKRAQGDFVVFCDSDDVVNPAYLQILMSGWQEGVLPIVQHTLEEGQMEEETGLDDKQIFCWAEEQGRKCFEHCLRNGWLQAPYCKLFARKIILDHKLTFDETMCVGEDFKFVLQYLQHCHQICWIQNSLYYYRDNPNSITKRMGESKIQSKEKIRAFLHEILEELPGEKTELMELAYCMELEDYYNVMLLIYAYNRECRSYHKKWKQDPVICKAMGTLAQSELSWKRKLFLEMDHWIVWELLALAKRAKDFSRGSGRQHDVKMVRL